MSFILDALKKSDSERQRQAGPALFEVRSAVQRTGLPTWAIALGALLLVNIVALGWFVLRSPAAATSAPPVASAAKPTSTGAVASVSPVASIGSASPASVAPVAARPVLPPREATHAAAPPAVGYAENPADYEEALPEGSAQPSRYPAPEPASGASFAPTLARLPASIANQLPPLHIDMHVYATRAADRFMLLNMQRLREGDATRDGVRVEEITPTGAVMSFRGTRFLLERD